MPRLHEAAAAGNIDQVKEYLAAGDAVDDMFDTVNYEGVSHSSGRTKRNDVGREMTPLHLAAYHGQSKVAKLLIDAGADVNKKDGWNHDLYDTPIEIAYRNKNFGLARLLQEHGAVYYGPIYGRNIQDELFHAALYHKPEVVDDVYSEGLASKADGEKTLKYAASYNALSVAQVLLENWGVSPNPDEDLPLNNWGSGEQTPLGIAVEAGHEKMVEFLLAHGAKVDQFTNRTTHQSDCTPLREALIHIGKRGANPRIIELLLSWGAEISKINARGLSMLASHGKPEELEILLQQGLDPNISSEGKRLLDRSIKEGRYDLARKFIEHGADVSAVDDEGKNYLHKCRDLELTKRLIEKGIDVELLDGKGKKPIQYMDVPSAEFLAERGASLSCLTMNDRTVLSSPLMTKMLIDKGLADFSIRDSEGRTPLCNLAQSACLPGYVESLKVILDNVIDLSVNEAGTQGGWTPLHNAFAKNQGFVNFGGHVDDQHVAESRYTQVIDLLIAKNAYPLRDKSGRTPLMGMTFNGFSMTFNHAVIRRYCKFEADYYGVPVEIYEKLLTKVREQGFDVQSTDKGIDELDLHDLLFFRPPMPRQTPIQAFWDELAKQRKNHCVPKLYENNDFHNSEFINTTAICCIFSNCNMQHVKFYNCNLINAKFINCDLSDADFKGSDLMGATFENCTANGLEVTKEWLQNHGALNVDLVNAPTAKSELFSKLAEAQLKAIEAGGRTGDQSSFLASVQTALFFHKEIEQKRSKEKAAPENEALMLAVSKNDIPGIETAIASGANVSFSNFYGRTPLMNAAADDHGLDMVKLLLERGASVDGVDFEQCSALHFAVFQGNLPMTKLLLEAGAKKYINHVYIYDLTPLKLAKNKGQEDLVKLLQSYLVSSQEESAGLSASI